MRGCEGERVKEVIKKYWSRIYGLRQWLIYHQRKIVFDQVTWMGMPIWKNPLDAWIYQEIIHEVH
jgi:cephalosporin hydroxylase